MAKKLALWVVVRASAARVSTFVESTHQSLEAAKKAARRRGLGYEAMSAQLVHLMQVGFSYTDALQALAGAPIELARVEVHR